MSDSHYSALVPSGDSTAVPRNAGTRGPTILSRDASDALFERIVQLTRGQGELVVSISSQWRGNVRWANNNLTTAGDTTQQRVSIRRRIDGAGISYGGTNQFDDASLARVLDRLAYQIRFDRKTMLPTPLDGPQQYLQPTLFFESTSNLVAAERSRIGHELAASVESANLRSAGYLAVESTSVAAYTTNGLRGYAQETKGQYSVTVRNNKDNGSGWAGVDQNDWNRIDVKALTARAQQKCIASADPRAIEPGRYVAVLEPQAVHDLMQFALGGTLLRVSAESSGPYHYRADETKLGMHLLDSRITITSDPMDPECGYIPFVDDGWTAGEPMRKANWFTNGVLTDLTYDRGYALGQLGHSVPNPGSGGYRMSGGTSTVEEMIATTKRGVLVTRLSHMHVIDAGSLVVTGVTRDGLWLIENGKITYAIKNFRFNESPLFAFNNVEQLGLPVRVFSPESSAVVPPVKVRDFNFSGLADAV